MTQRAFTVAQIISSYVATLPYGAPARSSTAPASALTRVAAHRVRDGQVLMAGSLDRSHLEIS